MPTVSRLTHRPGFPSLQTVQKHANFQDCNTQLSADLSFVCPRCQGKARPIDGRPATAIPVDDCLLDVESEFCYLGDMLSASGGCTQAIIARCRVAWGKFRKLLPILTSRHLSPLVRGRVFNLCAWHYYMAARHGPSLCLICSGPTEP